MIKDFLKENGHTIYISIDMGILFMGIFMTFIGVYSPICGATQNDARMTIGAGCMAIWFIMFPAISREKKDKIMSAIVIHMLIAFGVLVTFLLEIKYFLGSMQQENWFLDIVFCVAGIFVVSYLLYVLAGFIKTFFQMVEKVKRFIFPKLKEVSGVINVIEAITAGVLSITAFGASILGVITLAKQFIDIFNL